MVVTTVTSMEVKTIETSNQILAFIQLAYGVPSLILMIFFLVLCGVSKSYSGSFYRVVQLDLLVNIVCYLNTWFSLRIEIHPFVTPFLKQIQITIPGLLTCTKFTTNFFMHMQFCSAIALSFHRISSVLYHTRYEYWWSSWYALYGIISAVYSFLPQYFVGLLVDVSIINGTLSKIYYVERVTLSMQVTAVFSAIYFALLVVVGMTTSYLVSNAIHANLSDRGVSRKLTNIALTYGIVYTGILLWSVLSGLNSSYDFLPNIVVRFNTTFLLFSSDMMTLALPYILLIFDTNVKAFIAERKPKRRQMDLLLVILVVIYSSIFVVGFTGNLLMVVVTFHSKHLNSNCNILICICCFCDLLLFTDIVAFVISMFIPITQEYCFYINIPADFGAFASNACVFTIGIDRVLSVASPVVYKRLEMNRYKYITLLMVFPVIYALALLYLGVGQRDPFRDVVCLLPESLGHAYDMFALTSFFINLTVPPLYCYVFYKCKTMRMNGSSRAVFRSLTVTVCLVVCGWMTTDLIGVLTVTLPMDPGVAKMIQLYCGTFIFTSSAFNVFVYYKMSRDYRLAIREFLGVANEVSALKSVSYHATVDTIKINWKTSSRMVQY